LAMLQDLGYTLASASLPPPEFSGGTAPVTEPPVWVLLLTALIALQQAVRRKARGRLRGAAAPQ
jgi:hypothetical protein